MRIFVTGATGFIGSAVTQELLRNGHRVLGLARSEANAQKLTAAGAEVHRGSLEDLESLTRGAAACEGVIHTAFNHDFVNVSREVAAKADLTAIETIGAALAGSDRPFVICSGSAAAGFEPGRLGTEADEADAKSAVATRLPSERATLALATRGVRAIVMRLPPSVHGEGDHGLVYLLIGIARAKGASAFIGDGANRWPAAHRLDVARLFRLAVEKGPPGSRFHGVAEEGVPTRDIAKVIGRHLKLPVVSKTGQEALEHFGWLGHFFALDCPASSARTREQLSWHPTHPALLPDLDQGHYFKV